jgi:4-hydroxy-tetrahydrodipicolinate reductase
VAVIEIGVLGVPGRMARQVIAAILDAQDLALRAAVARPGSPHVGEDAGTLAGGPRCGIGVTDDPRALAEAHVIVDFSSPAALAAALPAIARRPLVTGTTGLDPATLALRDAHARAAPLLAAANFSVGIAVLRDLVRRAAGALPDADIEIVEAHHRHKKDAPSGTALALGESVGRAVTMHSIRGGDVVGEHEVWLMMEGERLRLGHSASSRATFARGALRAARWLHGRPPGAYDLAAVLGLE